MSNILDLTESPIERQLFDAMLTNLEEDETAHIRVIAANELAWTHCADHLGDSYGIYTFWPQREIGPFRVDFLASFIYDETGEIRKLIIEADGHDFHEKTKEQARHDKERDRMLLAAGYTTCRFTGSEIYNRPEECAEDALHLLRRQAPLRLGQP